MSKKKKQPGFLARVKTNGTTYIYLRQAKRTPNGIKNERIYSFGPDIKHWKPCCISSIILKNSPNL